MLEGILQGLFQWIYGMFLDLIAYCANGPAQSNDNGFTVLGNQCASRSNTISNFRCRRLGVIAGKLRFPSRESDVCGIWV